MADSLSAGRFAARIRMPFMAVALVLTVAAAVVGPNGWWTLAGLVLLAAAFTLYFRLGTPRGAAVPVRAPVEGRWRVLNSPTTKVPSHGLHAWSQTYAFDLVADPVGGERPTEGWPPARRPSAYPGFGQPVLAPTDGEVVRAVGWTRDHMSRIGLLGFAYFLLESVRELGGPPGILGNHVVIRRDDGTCVLVAHLRRRSLRVRRGDQVTAGTWVADCGNSGNSTEPHVHIQAMDHPSVWIAAARPLLVDGAPPPRDGGHIGAEVAIHS
ncbi:MAG: M23 family metallopeptidase [Thermoleophilia bacterium]|nr:M23 family metallopeptidase [Thermoleophilia bacterium]